MLSRHVLLLIDKVNPIHPLSTLKKWSPIESGYDCFHCMMPYTKHSTHNKTVFVIEATHSNYSSSAILVINRQNNTTKSNREQFTWFAWCILKTKVKYVFYMEMKMNWNLPLVFELYEISTTIRRPFVRSVCWIPTFRKSVTMIASTHTCFLVVSGCADYLYNHIPGYKVFAQVYSFHILCKVQATIEQSNSVRGYEINMSTNKNIITEKPHFNTNC